MININLLPKHLRRVREPGYWRVIAVMFPLLVLGTLAFLQYARNQVISNFEDEVIELEARKRELQPFIAEQQALQTQLAQLNELLTIRDQVRDNTIVWTSEIGSMLELLPARGNSVRPRINFNSLTMQAVTPPTAEESRFEGEPIIAQMNVSGDVINTEVLADFIGALEASENFGVSFQNASREDDTGFYTYSLNIGALAGGER